MLIVIQINFFFLQDCARNGEKKKITFQMAIAILTGKKQNKTRGSIIFPNCLAQVMRFVGEIIHPHPQIRLENSQGSDMCQTCSMFTIANKSINTAVHAPCLI